MTSCNLINIPTKVDWIDGNNDSYKLDEHKSNEKVEDERRLVVHFDSLTFVLDFTSDKIWGQTSEISLMKNCPEKVGIFAWK